MPRGEVSKIERFQEVRAVAFAALADYGVALDPGWSSGYSEQLIDDLIDALWLHAEFDDQWEPTAAGLKVLNVIYALADLYPGAAKDGGFVDEIAAPVGG